MAREICLRLAISGDLQAAADAEIRQVGELGGAGGVIALDVEGHVVFSLNTSGMYRGAVSSETDARVAIYGDED